MPDDTPFSQKCNVFMMMVIGCEDDIVLENVTVLCFFHPWYLATSLQAEGPL